MDVCESVPVGTIDTCGVNADGGTVEGFTELGGVGTTLVDGAELLDATGTVSFVVAVVE